MRTLANALAGIARRFEFGFASSLLLTVCSLAGAVPSTAFAASAEKQEYHWLIPYPAAQAAMRATMRLPSGSGPFPLAVINHGTSESELLRQDYAAPEFDLVSSWFLQRGYAVLLPQRPGHGETGGAYLESSGSCDAALYQQAGDATADAVRTAIDYAMQFPFVRHRPVVLVGHSAGAWGSLALAAEYPQMVGAVVNFAGGRGGRSYGLANSNCAPERLVQAAAAYGRTTRAKTLWLYSANDSYFGPELSRRMAEAFRAAGGAVDYHLLPPMPDDGHFLIFQAGAVPLWSPLLEDFLNSRR